MAAALAAPSSADGGLSAGEMVAMAVALLAAAAAAGALWRCSLRTSTARPAPRASAVQLPKRSQRKRLVELALGPPVVAVGASVDAVELADPLQIDAAWRLAASQDARRRG